jgi:phosphopentomutase
MENRVFLIVLDSFGIGNAPDAEKFHDEGSNTLASIMNSDQFHAPNMEQLGLFAIDGVEAIGKKEGLGAYGRLQESSMGKDTTIGHWEIAGIISPNPLPTYPNGFPEEIIQQFEQATRRKVLCNKPYSGTEVIKEYGREHVETGALIVYTSADSVFQIAAHEEIVPTEQLYEYCRIARELLHGEHGVGRVIARPFTGEYPNYQRTPKRHDFSLLPPRDTILDALSQAEYTTIGVGKIYDIFAGKGIRETYSIKNNTDGMNQTIELLEKEFRGLCFVNLVDFDMVYGHRNDIEGYAKAISEFDTQLQQFMEGMKEDDVLIITADHGCDPGFPGTDHTRECVPVMIYGNGIRKNVNLGTRTTYADIGATILEIFGIENITDGTSFWNEVR